MTLFNHIRRYTLWLVMALVLNVQAAPIRDITNVYGDRTNQLIGYGLVVGLDGSGDKSQVKFTSQSVVTWWNNLGYNWARNPTQN